MGTKRGWFQPSNIQLGSITSKCKLERSQRLGHGCCQGPWGPLWMATQPRHQAGVCPPALASELPVEHVADGPDLMGVFLHMRGLLPAAPHPHPTERHSGSPTERWACQEKKPQRQMLGKVLSLGSASQLGDLGEVTFSICGSVPCLGKWMTAQVKVKDQGGAFPGQTHWEAGTCNSPFPLENPQPATSLQSKNPSDAPVLQQRFRASN